MSIKRMKAKFFEFERRRNQIKYKRGMGEIERIEKNITN